MARTLQRFVARTFRTLSLSLPPEAVQRLETRGRDTGKTAARVAAEVVLQDLSMAEPLELQPQDGGDFMLVHNCVVHERDRGGMISRQHQSLSLVDITRIRGGRVDVFEVFLGGDWLVVEGRFDEFKVIWENAKRTAAGLS